jgi:sigma-B regulation protein RsbU (phosphoserine phosphatase)
VSGKGVPAALYGAFVGELVRSRTFRRRYTPVRSGPADVLASMNTILHDRQLEAYFCTLCYAMFDFERRLLTIANSGLPYPIRWSAGTAAPIELPGVPLGLVPATQYDELTFDLIRGDLYVFCSDGLSEAVDLDGRDFGTARIIEIVQRLHDEPVQEIVDGLLEAVATFRRDGSPADDMTVVALRITK